MVSQTQIKTYALVFAASFVIYLISRTDRKKTVIVDRDDKEYRRLPNRLFPSEEPLQIGDTRFRIVKQPLYRRY